MKNFIFGIMAGLILFVGYNNKTAVVNAGRNVIKGTAHLVSKAFTPEVAQSQELVQQQVVERKAVKRVTKQIAKVAQSVASKILPKANAAEIPAPTKIQVQVKQPQYIASTNNNYMIPQRVVSPQVSQNKSNKRQNSRTSISLVTE